MCVVLGGLQLTWDVYTVSGPAPRLPWFVSHFFPKGWWLCTLRAAIFHGERSELFQSSEWIPSSPSAILYASVAPFSIWSLWCTFMEFSCPWHFCVLFFPTHKPINTHSAADSGARFMQQNNSQGAQHQWKGLAAADESEMWCQLNFHSELKYPTELWIFTSPAFTEILATIWKCLFIFGRKEQWGYNESGLKIMCKAEA